MIRTINLKHAIKTKIMAAENISNAKTSILDLYFHIGSQKGSDLCILVFFFHAKTQILKLKDSNRKKSHFEF